MRRYLPLLILLFCIEARGFDWKSQSNEEIRSDMISFAEGFAQRAKGTPEGKVLRKFIKEQKKNADNPYSWIVDTKNVVLKLETMCPPVKDDSSSAAQMRRDIFLLMDFPIHADNRHPEAPGKLKEEFDKMSDEYRAYAREKALKTLKAPGPSKPGELQIIKIYNCGVILRTCERTLVVDVKWEGDSTSVSFIASIADAFFLSHPHSDHYNREMINALARYSVKSILPQDVSPDLHWEGKTVIHEDMYCPILVNGVKTIIQKGNQNSAPNNLYYLDFDGWRVLLPGESHDFPKLSDLTRFQSPDLILFPSWNRMDLMFEAVSRMKGYDKDKVICIPEHENEFNHTVEHRESFHELFTRKDRLGRSYNNPPTVMILEIGENKTLTKF